MIADDFHDCNAVAKALVQKFVAISLPSDNPLSCTTVSYGHVFAYVVDFPTLRLIWHDAIKHGDGDRMITFPDIYF